MSATTSPHQADKDATMSNTSSSSAATQTDQVNEKFHKLHNGERVSSMFVTAAAGRSADEPSFQPTRPATPEKPSFQALPLNEDNPKVRFRKEKTHVPKDMPTPLVLPRLEKEKDSSITQTTTHPPPWRAAFQGKLYQRSDEEALLYEAFKTAQTTPTQKLILLSGPSGVGKTRLAKALRSHVGAGYFVLGKFDQLRQAAPYTAFVHAFSDLTQQVVSDGSTEEVQRIRNAILRATGTETSVLTGMIPALEQILGCCDGGSSEQLKAPANTGGALQRFVFVFRQFIRSLCSPEKPIVLVLDDLQYADMCSLDLFFCIASDRQNQGLVLVATCGDTVRPDSYLAAKLRDLEDRGETSIANIPLSNLSQTAIQEILRDALLINKMESHVLAELVYDKTRGNMFFVIEYLIWLQDNSVLWWDSMAGRWIIDEQESKSMLQRGSKCSQSRDFMLGILQNLPPVYQQVLKTASCLGPTLDEKLLDWLVDSDLPPILESLRRRGILYKSCAGARFEFDHDMVQDAAYRLIPEEDRELFHLDMGRKIWKKLRNDEEVDIYVFVVLSQMAIGRNLIENDDEQVAVATLCLHAGRKAAQASTFRTAAVYLDFGLGLMNDKRWRSHYDLMLALHNASAEMEMCRANFDRMNEVIAVTLRQTRVLKDKHGAYLTQLYALTSQNKSHEAVELGLEVLNLLGEGVKGLSIVNLLSEYRSVSKLLKGKSDEDILRMDRMTDEDKFRALQIVYITIVPALLERPDLTPFLLLKSIKITLQYGLSILACTSFAVYAIFCVGAGSASDATRFAELALVMFHRSQTFHYMSGLYACVFGSVLIWSRPVSECLEPLLQAQRVGAQTGDLELAGLCSNLYFSNAIHSGVALDEICKRRQGFQQILSQNKQESLVRLAMPSIQAVNMYMGIERDTLKESAASLENSLKKPVRDGDFARALSVKYWRMSSAYMFGRYEESYRYRVKMKEIKKMPPSLEQASSAFYLGMLSVEMVRQKGQVRKNSRTFRNCLRHLQSRCLGCPQNFVSKVFLLEAEMASFRGRNEIAFEKFICSIGMAQSNKFPHLAGLANERLAWHFYRMGKISTARRYFEDARVCYGEWRAHALVERLDVILENLSEEY